MGFVSVSAAEDKVACFFILCKTPKSVSGCTYAVVRCMLVPFGIPRVINVALIFAHVLLICLRRVRQFLIILCMYVNPNQMQKNENEQSDLTETGTKATADSNSEDQRNDANQANDEPVISCSSLLTSSKARLHQ